MSVDTSSLFSSLPLREELLQALSAVNYVHMSEVQSNTASAMLDGRDMLVQAETGSGKTAAFAIGILNKLDASQFSTQALVICPTRELSDQVAAEIRRLASSLANTRVLTLCGGKPMHDQLNSLKREPHIVVGTPGRLKKHLEKGTLHVSNIQSLVLDEADRMLDMGFYDDIMSILKFTNEHRQTLLYSATYPEEIIAISRAVHTDPVEVRIQSSNNEEKIKQVFVLADDAQKPEMLFRAFGKYQFDNAIIFCNRKNQVEGVCESLRSRGWVVAALHGDLEQRERDEAVILFSNKSASFLVATDVAARGLDISELSAVINYDITPDPETHLHRIGRTGRAGREGIAITLVKPDEVRRVQAIEEFIGSEAVYVKLDESDKDDAQNTKPPMRTIQISAGKKDKIRPGDIVGALTSTSDLSNDNIGKITVQSKVSFVAVDASIAKLALRQISEGKIKKRRVRARLIG